jgi:EmrB/QacA subfamily drug resistance transporter
VTPARRWSALALIVSAQFMVILDVAIVNVTLPTIKTDLGFSSATTLQWVVTSYAILFGGTLLLGGRIADLLGRRRMFMAGMALFAASSLLCGLAWSAGSLIAFRAVQGLGGALLVPAALALLMTIFPEGRDRNIALGVYGAAFGSGGAVGNVLGGVITTYAHWSWVFFLNVPVGVAALVLAPFLLAESRAELPVRHFDVWGAVSITSGLMLLVYAMTRATAHGWSSPGTVGLIAAALALVGLFVWIERRSPSPLLPLRLFRLPTLAAANAVAAIIGSWAFAAGFTLSLYLQEVLGYTPLQAGASFSAWAISVIVVSNLSRFVIDRIGLRFTLTIGLLTSLTALTILLRLPEHGHYFWDLFPAFLIGGAGTGLSVPPVTIAALSGVGASDSGVASGLINTSRQMGGAVGLALLSSLAALSSSHYAAAHGVSASSIPALDHGFQVALLALAGLLGAAAVIAFTFVRPRRVRVREAALAEAEQT